MHEELNDSWEDLNMQKHWFDEGGRQSLKTSNSTIDTLIFGKDSIPNKGYAQTHSQLKSKLLHQQFERARVWVFTFEYEVDSGGYWEELRHPARSSNR